jgi:hypothetical protein
MPDWNDYYPDMLDHYESLCREMDQDIHAEQVALHAVNARNAD